MSTEFWGNMPKDQGDSEKPEEMADRVVQEHDDDPDAHLDEGQSLKSHRATEIIDHRARSVVGDKINGLDDAWEGADQGTVTDFDVDEIEDTSKAWEVNEWADHWVYIPGTIETVTFRKIVSNTADTLTFAGAPIPLLAVDQVFVITKIKYFGDWIFVNNAEGAYNNRIAMTDAEDDYIEYEFVGNKIAVLLSLTEESGDVEIYIDDVLQDTISLYAEYTSRRFIRWETEFDTIPETPRVLKLVAIDDGGGNIGCELEAIDVNGVIEFSSLNIPMYTVLDDATTDADGYASFDIAPPPGYYFIGICGIGPQSLGAKTDQRPVILHELRNENYRIYFFNGKALTNFGFVFQLLVARKDAYYEES